MLLKKSKGKSLLNLFAYTGSVSVQAALAGAEKVTTVDMSNTYLDWAKDNFELNKLRGHKYEFIQADCLKWLADNKNTYDGCIYRSTDVFLIQNVWMKALMCSVII